ncbi:hypothetical protein [Streptomyces sp. SP2-10]|uniref:hypothetical protein n=1 Tax=Streptomyces sp. SP2-10 TaxID=2873385 RepID=UPI001CA730CB|nr:hypothetical protein [Streptomyces sp. SP2-10]MBY8846551.1 hypothetical protein [Streptomyces sp. SP2-10]
MPPSTGVGESEQLFTRTLYWYAKDACMPRTGLSCDTAVERIRAFTAWANQLATAHDRPHDRPHELIPPDPDGAVALRRFRRTIAWFIYRQPGGRIALAVQYGHAATAMSESYAGRSMADMLEVLDQERALPWPRPSPRPANASSPTRRSPARPPTATAPRPPSSPPATPEPTSDVENCERWSPTPASRSTRTRKPS